MRGVHSGFVRPAAPVMPFIGSFRQTRYTQNMAKQKLTTMNISMPVSTRKWIEKRMKAEGCTNASEFFRLLVRADQRAAEEVRRLLAEGEKSGSAKPMTQRDWDEVRHAAKHAGRDRRRKSA